MNDYRKFARAPLHIAVSYRTAGSFLVAYTVNLSKGGIFIEATPLPVGSDVSLELSVPGVGDLDIEGVVTWTREANQAGLPLGMGVAFSRPLDEQHGGAIDRLVSSFEGLEILLAGSIERRAQLRRYVTSILACDTLEASSLEIAATALHDRVDLVIVDLTTAGNEGYEIVAMACRGPNPTPVIALAATDDTRRWAKAQGVAQLVREPPTFHALQQAVIAALAHATSR